MDKNAVAVAMDNLDGCGCMASKVVENYPDDMETATVVVGSTIAAVAVDDSDRRPSDQSAQLLEIDLATYVSFETANLEALNACSSWRSF